MASATNRLVLNQETLKGGNVFKNYAKRVTGDVNTDIAKNDKISTKSSKK